MNEECTTELADTPTIEILGGTYTLDEAREQAAEIVKQCDQLMPASDAVRRVLSDVAGVLGMTLDTSVIKTMADADAMASALGSRARVA